MGALKIRKNGVDYIIAGASASDLNGYLAKSGNLSGLADIIVARNNLGLGNIATKNAGTGLGFNGANELIIANGGVNFQQIANEAVSDNHIDTYAGINAAKINDGSVTNSDFAGLTGWDYTNNGPIISAVNNLLNNKANTSEVVKLTSNQTITGVKIFNDDPLFGSLGRFLPHKYLRKNLALSTTDNTIGHYYDLFQISFSNSLEGNFKISLQISGPNYGINYEYNIPTSYMNDYLAGYGFLAVDYLWVTLTPVSFSGRSGLAQDTLTLQMQAVGNTINFRIRQTVVLAGSPIFYFNLSHSNNFRDTTINELYSEGNEIATYPVIPALLSGTSGTSYFHNNVGIGVLNPQAKLDVAGKINSTGYQVNGVDVVLGGGGGGSPTGGAGGVLSGTYPNPGFAVNMATQAELDAGLAGKADGSFGTAERAVYARMLWDIANDFSLIKADDGELTYENTTSVYYDTPSLSAHKFGLNINNIDNTSDLNKPISTVTQTALNLKANLNSPTFTGTVLGINKSMVGLGNVDNTSDSTKPISTATQAALNNKADLVGGFILASQIPGSIDDVLEYTDLASFPATGQSGKMYISLATNVIYRWSGSVYAEISPTLALGTNSSTAFRGDLGQTAYAHSQIVTGNPHGTTKTDLSLGNVDNTSDTNKPVSTSQQTALNLKANLASPTFTGTVNGITATMVGLGNVNNTADSVKPVSTAQQSALDLKANLASPSFTGTVSGITKTMVGLSLVDNTADTTKPVSTPQQTALNLKANLASPTFTGTVAGITALMVGLGNVTNDAQVKRVEMGAVGGVATLDSAGKVTNSQIPNISTNEIHQVLGNGNNFTIYNDILVNTATDTLTTIQTAIRAKTGRSTAVVSGTITAPIAAGPFVANPTTALNSSPGPNFTGTTGTYKFAYSHYTSQGETALSPIASFTMTNGTGNNTQPIGNTAGNGPGDGILNRIYMETVPGSNVLRLVGSPSYGAPIQVTAQPSGTAMLAPTTNTTGGVGVSGAANLTIQYSNSDGNVGDIEAIPGPGYIGLSYSPQEISTALSNKLNAPVVTTSIRNLLVPSINDVVKNTNSGQLEVWDGAQWVGIWRYRKESTVTINANNEGWTDSGIVLTTADVVSLFTSGEVDFNNTTTEPLIGPNGVGNVGYNGLSDYGVVGVVLPEGTYPNGATAGSFNVGAVKGINTVTGRLWLRMNDSLGAYGDNTGQFTTKLYLYSSTPLNIRNTFSLTTPSLTNNEVTNQLFAVGRTAHLLQITTNIAAEIRLYTSSAARSADVSRAIGVDPTPGSGLLTQVVTSSGNLNIPCTPSALLFNLDTPTNAGVYASVKNLSGATAPVTVTLNKITLEN